MPEDDIRWINEKLVELNSMLREAVKESSINARYVATDSALASHELCTNQSWVNGVGAPGTLYTPFHPDPRGQARLADYLEFAWRAFLRDGVDS